MAINGNQWQSVAISGNPWQSSTDAEDRPERRALPRELDDTRAAHVRTCMRPEHGHAACIRAARVEHGGRVLDVVEHGDAAVRRELRVVALDAAVRMITIDEAHVESRPTAPCPFGFAFVESKAAIKGLAKTTRIERTGLRNGLIAIGGLTPRRMALGWPLGARGGPNGVMLQSSVCLRTARPSKDTLRRVIKANVP